MIIKKKKMKRVNSSKSMEKQINGDTVAREDFSPTEGPPTRYNSPVLIIKMDASPNYMKPTSSSDARKEQLMQVTTHSSLADRTIKHKISRSLKKSPSSSVNSGPRYAKRISRKASIRLRMPSSTKSISTSLSTKKAIDRSTCSSAFKQSRFTKVTELDPGNSEAEKTCINHFCPFHYCSINGEKHEHSSPLKPFPSLKERRLKSRMNMKVKKQSSFKRRSFRKGREEELRNSHTERTNMDVLIENHPERYEIIHIDIDKEIEDYSGSSEEEDEGLEEVMILNQDPGTYNLTVGEEYDLNQVSDIFCEAAVGDNNFLKLETGVNLCNTLLEYYTGRGVDCYGLQVYENRKRYLEDCHDRVIIDVRDQIEDCGYFSDGSVQVFNNIEEEEKGNIGNEFSDASQNSLITVEEEQSSRQSRNIEFEAGSLEDNKDDSKDGVEIQVIKMQQNSIYDASDNHDNAMQNIITDFRQGHLSEEVGDGLMLAEDDDSLNCNEEMKEPVSQNVKRASNVNDHQIQNVPVPIEVYVEASDLYDNESLNVLVEVSEGEGSSFETKNIDSLILPEENVPPNSNDTIQVLAGFHVEVSDVPDHPKLNEIGYVLDKEGSSQAMEVTVKWFIVQKITNASTNEEIKLLLRCNTEASAMPAYTTARTVIASVGTIFLASSAMIEECIPFTRNKESKLTVSWNFKPPDWPYHPVHRSVTNLQEQLSSSKAKEMEHKLMQVEDTFPRGSNIYVHGPFAKLLGQLKCYYLGEDYNGKVTLILEPNNSTEGQMTAHLSLVTALKSCDDSRKAANLEKADEVILDNGNEGQMTANRKAEANSRNEVFHCKESEVVNLEDYEIRAGLENATKNSIHPENNGNPDGKSEKDEFIIEKEIHQLLCGVYEIEQDNPQRSYLHINTQIEIERCNDAIEDSDIILKLKDYTYDTESDESNYENRELEEAEQDYDVRYNLRQCILQFNGNKENLIYISYDATNSITILSRKSGNQKAKYYIKQKKKNQSDLAKATYWHAPNFVPLNSEPDAWKVNLRHIIAYERKSAKEWMMDYALQKLVHLLSATRERNVPLLAESFDALLHHQLNRKI